MPANLPQTRAQLDANREKVITEAFNGQNTARKLKDLLQKEGYSWFNKAEDKLNVNDIEGLQVLFDKFALAIRTTPELALAGAQEEGLTANRLYLIEREGDNTVGVRSFDEGHFLLEDAWELTPAGPVPVIYDLVNFTTSPRSAGGGGGTATVDNVTETQYGFPAGPWSGSFNDFANTLLSKYQAPYFSFFTIGGTGSQDVEVGTSFPAGFKSFAWGTTNASNITPNSITIRDVTTGNNLATGEANDGSASISTSSLAATAGEFKRYRITATNTQNSPFTADVVYAGYYKVFYDTVGSTPTTSAQVRGLTNARLTNQGNAFTLNTGNTNTRFVVWLPGGKTITSVIDQDALNADITASYVGSSFSVNDAAGTPVAGTLYVMSQSIPYTANHRHLITIS